jgi:tellurite resistance protein TerC
MEASKTCPKMKVIAPRKSMFIVYASNVFAILGLRSLFFAISGIMRLFHYLHYGLAVVLSFVGIKMLLSNIYKIPIGVSLGIIATTVALSIVASMLWPIKEQPPIHP